MVEAFGKENGLSVRGQIDTDPPEWRRIRLSICKELGPTIKVRAFYSPTTRIPGQGIMIGFYEPRGESEWRSLARLFIAELRREWTGSRQVRTPEGKKESLPSDLIGK